MRALALRYFFPFSATFSGAELAFPLPTFFQRLPPFKPARSLSRAEQFPCLFPAGCLSRGSPPRNCNVRLPSSEQFQPSDLNRFSPRSFFHVSPVVLLILPFFYKELCEKQDFKICSSLELSPSVPTWPKSLSRVGNLGRDWSNDHGFQPCPFRSFGTLFRNFESSSLLLGHPA